MKRNLSSSLARRVVGSTVIGAAMAVALTGCGGGAASLPPNAAGGSSAAAVATAAAQPTSASSDVASTAPVSPGPSVPAVTASHADPALEALLPATVSGTAMQRSSATFADLIASGGDRTVIDGFLQGIGKTESDGTFAAAFDPTNALGGGIFAFKIVGVNVSVLKPAIVSVESADLGTGATTRQATVGGKDVTVVSVGNGVNDTEWVYGRDEVVFVFHAADEAHAATLIQALP